MGVAGSVVALVTENGVAYVEYLSPGYCEP